MKITVGEDTLDFRVEYGKCQKISIEMDHFGSVVVKAPDGTSEEAIVQGMTPHADSLIGRRKRIEALTQEPKERNYLEGEMFLYLGKEFPIKITVDESYKENTVAFNGKELHILSKSSDEQVLRDSLKKFYFRSCKKLINNRVVHFQKEFQIKPRSVEVNESKLNWGMCTAERKLTFNWRLIMAPEDVIDYIVIHEMCHMLHMNHERSFWRLVGKLMPDYEKKQAWLAYKNPTMTL
ncbi:MAG: M48 family metallopeptidase [Vallitaleaceae bacterium]|nr:M48 family metallopeptidase [Vallitaleaceae bacterium]